MKIDSSNYPRSGAIKGVCFITILGTACGSVISHEALLRIKTEKVTKRASFDLQCKESSIGVTELDNSTMGAAGCGKQVTYIVQKCSPGAGWTEEQVRQHLCVPVLNSIVNSR